MTVIAMTREMATRGSEVAAGVAERLGLSIIHHEIVEHDIAERTGMSRRRGSPDPRGRGVNRGAVEAGPQANVAVHGAGNPRARRQR